MKTAQNFETLVGKLQNKGYTISAMESCTGGGFMNALTNIPGASLVTKGGCVTYSNEDKIRCGVKSDIIDRYSVYSKECAKDMAQAVHQRFAATIGIGITGNFSNIDPSNPKSSKPGTVFIGVYTKNKTIVDEVKLPTAKGIDRKKQKDIIIKQTLSIVMLLLEE